MITPPPSELDQWVTIKRMLIGYSLSHYIAGTRDHGVSFAFTLEGAKRKAQEMMTLTPVPTEYRVTPNTYSINGISARPPK